MRVRSIARRLIVSVLLIQLISAIGVIGATVAYERHTHFQAFDVMLRGRADSLLGAVQESDDETDDVMLDRTDLQVPAEDIYEVRDSAGRVLGRSASWDPRGVEGSNPSVDGVFRARIGGEGYRMIRIHGRRVVDPGKLSGGTAHLVTILYGARTSGVLRQIREAVVFYAAASCLLLLVTGTLVAWLLHRGLSPLRELAAEAEGISSERWSFRPPDSARSTRELAPLATALESAVQRLEHSFDQQRRFVSDAGHELKTAVAVLKSSLQLLTMRQRRPEEYEAGLLRSLTDCERMEEIVGKMLTLARLEGGANGDAVARSGDMASAAKLAADQLEPLAQLRQVNVVMRLAEDANVALSQEECVLLCSNLLMNAVQHSAAGSVIDVTARRIEGGGVEFRVEDQGEGIDESILPHVFERFYRGDPSRARKTGGTGLGLAICKAIVQRVGGTIHLDSDKGRGTAAIVRLPPAEGRQCDALESAKGLQASSANVNQYVED